MTPDVLVLAVLATAAFGALVHSSVRRATEPLPSPPAQSPVEASDPVDDATMDPGPTRDAAPSEVEAEDERPTVLWSADDWQAFMDGRS